MDDGDELFNPFAVEVDGDITFGTVSSARPSQGPPKPTARFQPKLKGRVPKTEASAEPHASPSTASSSNAGVPLPVKKQEDSPDVKPVPVEKQEDEPKGEGVERKPVEFSGFNGIVKVDDEVLDGSVPMDVDMVDEVVREIDVFLNPSPLDADTQLYVMQYPLRPFWRPYELDERCQKVRIKAQQTKVEVDLIVDADSENYDNEVDEHLSSQIQTLSSSKVPFVTSYAVGILKENQLHLNPVDAVVQLRSSLEHLKASRVQKRKNAVQVRGADLVTDEENEEDTSKPSSSQKKLPQVNEVASTDDAEDWVSLEFHPTEHPFAGQYRQKMIAEGNSHIQFHMNPHDYLDNLCPVIASNNDRTKGQSKGVLLSMPLEERLKILFSKEPQVHRFDALMHLAPTDSVDDVLKLLPQHAYLVQGLWVSKRPLLYKDTEVKDRDYILLLFSKSNVIPNEKLKSIKEEVQKRILNPLARCRKSLKDWKFKDPTDLSFIKRHPHVVKEQESIWSNREKEIMDAYASRISRRHMQASTAKQIRGVALPNNVDHGTSGVGDSNEKLGTRALSEEAREAVPKAVIKVLRNHKVCSLNMISQRLREMALSESTLSKGDPRTSINAALGFTASSRELKNIISQVAIEIHDVYVLKCLGNPALDPFRNVVIDLYRGSMPGAKLKKANICEAAKSVLNREISNSEYNQVMNELCVSHKGGGWALKSGDGKPD